MGLVGLVKLVELVGLMGLAKIDSRRKRRKRRKIEELEKLGNGIPGFPGGTGFPGENGKPGENGFLVEPENEQALVQAIKQILCDPAKADTMARNNLKKAWQYTIETMTEKHLEVFGLPGGMTEPG